QCSDRTQAETEFVGREIAIPKDALPPAGEGEYYWQELVGLRMRLTSGEDAGVGEAMLATAAHHVPVVTGDSHSLARRERLMPWVPEQFILEVNLEEGWLEADWSPDF